MWDQPHLKLYASCYEKNKVWMPGKQKQYSSISIIIFYLMLSIFLLPQCLSINFDLIRVTLEWTSIPVIQLILIEGRKLCCNTTPKLKQLATKRPLLLLDRIWLMEQELIPELLMIWLSPVFKGDSTEPSSHQFAHFCFHQ